MTADVQQEDTKDNLNLKEPFLVRVFKIFRGILISDKKIGELNGKWAAMFKMSVVGLIFLVPTCLTWGVWVTNGVFESKSHNAAMYEQHLFDRMAKLEKQATVCDQRSSHVTRLEKDVDTMEDKIVKLDKNNTSEHSKILTSLDSMKELLQYIKDK